MLDFLAGEAVTITVPFTRDGEPFVPDVDSVTWSLRGQDGTVLVASTTLPGVTDTFVALGLDAAHHNLVDGRIFEKRTLGIQARSEGIPYSWSTTYRIHIWLNLTVDEASIRGFIGCDESELPDQDIDILGAYLRVANLAGLAPLTDALSSGTIREMQANNAIIAQGVLDALPGLAQRLAKKETDGNRNVERFALDVAHLESLARGALKTALEGVAVVDDTLSAPTIFIVGSRVDPVTGA